MKLTRKPCYSVEFPRKSQVTQLELDLFPLQGGQGDYTMFISDGHETVAIEDLNRKEARKLIKDLKRVLEKFYYDDELWEDYPGEDY